MFLECFFGFSLTACANEKSGFDMVFIAFAAHSHVRKVMKNMKNGVKIGDAFRDSPGHAFGLHFGAFWGPFGEPWGVTLGKKGVQIELYLELRNACLRVTAGNFGKDPVGPYKPSFLEPSGSLPRAIWRIFLEPRGLQASLDCGL